MSVALTNCSPMPSPGATCDSSMPGSPASASGVARVDSTVEICAQSRRQAVGRREPSGLQRIARCTQAACTYNNPRECARNHEITHAGKQASKQARARLCHALLVLYEVALDALARVEQEALVVKKKQHRRQGGRVVDIEDLAGVRASACAPASEHTDSGGVRSSADSGGVRSSADA